MGEHDIRVFAVNLKTGDKVLETLSTIRVFLDAKPLSPEIGSFDYLWRLFLNTVYNLFGR